MRLGTKLIRGKLADMYDTTPPCALRDCGNGQEYCWTHRATEHVVHDKLRPIHRHGPFPHEA